MRKTLIIFKWEISKILTNWRKALTVFLFPAVLMMIALNLFPIIMNYISTGTVGRKPIVTLNAPDSFVDFTESGYYTLPYKFDFYESGDLEEKELKKILSKGSLIVIFSDNDFDEEIEDYYDEIRKGNIGYQSEAWIDINFDSNAYVMYGRAVQFQTEVLESYEDYCFDQLSGKYKKIGYDRFDLNDFNPITSVVLNRNTANSAASRLIPGIIMLLLYYCVYSLSCDMFAAEKDRGFLRKLLMTPAPPFSIFGGKTLAIIVISFVSSIVTYLVLFAASWLNISNDSMSLLPFGMLLTTKEFLAFLLVIPATSYVMCAICLSIVFSLEKMPDILTNLQFPLVLFLIEFFAQMARSAPPFMVEFLVPIHGTICALRDIFATDIRWSYLILTCLVDILVGTLMLRHSFKKIGD